MKPLFTTAVGISYSFPVSRSLLPWWGWSHSLRQEAHILCWFRPRQFPRDYKPIPAIPRTAPGHDPRQRPLNQKAAPLREFQHDHVLAKSLYGLILAGPGSVAFSGGWFVEGGVMPFP